MVCTAHQTFCGGKLRKMRRAGHVVGMGERRGAYRVLVGKPEGKRPLGKFRCRWEDTFNIQEC